MVLGVFCIWRLTEVNAAAAEIRDHWLIATRLLGDLNNFTSDFRAAEASHVITPDSAEMAKSAKEIIELSDEIAKAKYSYETLSHDTTENELWRGFTRGREDYRKVADEVISLSAKGKKTDGNRLYLTKSRTAYDAASDALDRSHRQQCRGS